MEVDQQPGVIAENGNVAGEGGAQATASGSSDGVNVMAGSGTSGSITVSLHPLVIMNISEHWTRTRAQNDGRCEPGKSVRVQLLNLVHLKNIYFF